MTLETKMQIEALKNLEKEVKVSYDKVEMFSSVRLDDAYELRMSDDMKKINSVTAVKLTCSDMTTWVNQKYLKDLKDKSTTFYAKDEKSPVYLVHNHIIYAVILPIYVDKKVDKC